MAVKWKDFAPYTKARFSKLNPEGQELINKVMIGRPAAIGGPWNDWYEKRFVDASTALQVQLGIDKIEADGLLRLAQTAQNNPEDEVTDAAGKFWTPLETLPTRDKFASDEDYRNALMKMAGQKDFAQQEADAKVDKAAADTAANLDSTINRIRMFAAEMLGPVAPDDPVMQGLMQSGIDAAQASAAQAGLSGRSGLAGTQAASVAQQNTLPYLGQRQSLGLSALSAAGNMELGLADMAAAEQKFMQDRNDMMAAERWKGQQNAAQGLWGGIGAVGGALLGGYLGGPQGAAAGASAGAAGGASLGTIGMPASPTYGNYRPSLSKKPSGNGGGAGY